MLTVSAPASSMLMGEHAVLFGHTAIVCAVEKRIFVTLTPRTDRQVAIYSDLKNLQIDLNRIVNVNENLEHIDELKFVLASIQAVNPQHGFDLNIRSEFSHTVGLGSSASVTASCIYALLLYKNLSENKAINLDLSLDLNLDDDQYRHLVTFDEVFNLSLNVIHKIQKRGSGSDLIASVYGGMQSYKTTKQGKQIIPLLDMADGIRDLPTLNLYYCGYKTPTPVVLAQVAEQSNAFPALYQGLYQHMNQVSEQAQTAILQKNWQSLGKLMNMYHGLLDALGVCDAQLASLIYGARAKPNVLGAKISGSGLGDCIITLTSDRLTSDNTSDNLIKNNHDIRIHDIEPIQVKISQEGLKIHQ